LGITRTTWASGPAASSSFSTVTPAAMDTTTCLWDREDGREGGRAGAGQVTECGVRILSSGAAWTGEGGGKSELGPGSKEQRGSGCRRSHAQSERTQCHQSGRSRDARQLHGRRAHTVPARPGRVRVCAPVCEVWARLCEDGSDVLRLHGHKQHVSVVDHLGVTPRGCMSVRACVCVCVSVCVCVCVCVCWVVCLLAGQNRQCFARGPD
jgi:hypothetical protein